MRRAGARRGRRGAALVVALAALTLLMALALALHAVTLRERRSARRASLVRAATDAAEGALARWQVQLAMGEPAEAFTDLAGAIAVVRVLEGGGDAGAGQGTVTGGAADVVVPTRVRVTLVTLADGARLLLSDAVATTVALRARRRVSLLLVPDTLPAAVGDSVRGGPRARLVPAPERAWAELP